MDCKSLTSVGGHLDKRKSYFHYKFDIQDVYYSLYIYIYSMHIYLYIKNQRCIVFYNY